MYHSPGYVDEVARLQRERVREEMRQIRLEEKALTANPKPFGLLEAARAFKRRLLEGRARPTAPGIDRGALPDALEGHRAGD